MSHILIIGAGASGLMAANALAGKHTVTVLEARERSGGRIHTINEKFTFPTEAGAEFIHGKYPLTLSLVKTSKSDISHIAGKRYQIIKGEVEEGDFMEDEWGLLEKTLKDLKTDTDMQSFLDLHFPADQYNDLRKRVKGFVEGFDVADIERVSSFALRHEWRESDEGNQFHIHGGYARIIDHLDDKVKKAGGIIHLNSPIEEIQWTQGKVKVSTNEGRIFEADKIIITVPLGVLQKGSIRFSPALPEHAKAFDSMGFGGVIKFLVEFEPNFWETLSHRPFHDLSFVFSDAVIPTWWTQRPDKIPLLTGWLGGPSTITSTHDQDSLYDNAISSLHTIFRFPTKEIEAAINYCHIADWVTDPFARGAYAYTTVQTNAALAHIQKPVKDTIFFAGEAFYQGPAMGTVEAALASGLKAASEIEK